MITHVVMFKFKPEDKAANMAEGIRRLLSMEGQVPSLRSIEAGHHEGEPARSMDVVLITRFDDVAGLKAYADDPFHGEVKKFLAGVLETSYVVDFASAPR